MQTVKHKYALILIACNEEKYIEKTVESIICQIIQPALLKIVLNNCTDSTEKIIKPFCEKNKWIHYSQFNNSSKRNFANKAVAFNWAYKQIAEFEFEFIGNIDADVVLPTDYYQLILNKLSENNKLGIAGGHFYEIDKNRVRKNYEFSMYSVSGSIQLFRRQCFETIGGYKPVLTGGIDMCAEIMARYFGWETRSFPDILFLHNRQLGTADASVYVSKFREGVRDSAIGYSSIYFFAKCIRRLIEYPIFIGSLFRIIGFLYAKINYKQKALDLPFQELLHVEQRKRIISFLPDCIKLFNKSISQ